MEEIVFKIGGGKVVHFGIKYSNGAIESSCRNSYADERNKDTKEYTTLDEITCKTCKSHKKWRVDLENYEKEMKEKAKTFKLKKIKEVQIGEIYKEKVTEFHFSGKYPLNKAKVLAIIVSDIRDNSQIIYKVVVSILDENLNPVLNSHEKELVNSYELEYFKEKFLDIFGSKLNA